MSKVKAPATCPITIAEWNADKTKPHLVAKKIAEELPMEKKLFSSGNRGFYASGKITLLIDGTPVKCQASMMAVIVNSKVMEAGTSLEAKIDEIS